MKKGRREELIRFFETNHRAPVNSKSVKEERNLYGTMYHLCNKMGGDAEIIALREQYKEETERYAATRKTEGRLNGTAIAEAAMKASWSDRISRIRKEHDLTGNWPTVDSADYRWIVTNKSKTKSEEIQKLWEDMHSGEKIQKKTVKTKPTDNNIGAKKVSDLTLSEVSELLKLIGDKTVAELIAEPEKPKEPEKVDVSKIETSLSDEVVRMVVNPEAEITVSNPEWKKAVEILEYIVMSDTLKNHMAYERLLEPAFVRELAEFVKNNPRKHYAGRKDKIVEKLYAGLSPDKRFFDDPAKVRDLIESCF